MLRIFAAALPVIVRQLERAAKRGQHAEAEQVHLQQLQLVEIVLVPLHDGAILHGGVLDRHQLIETAGGNDDAADVLRQVAREAHQLVRELHHLHEHRAFGIDAGFAHALLVDLGCRPTTEWSRASRASCSGSSPKALPTSRTALRGRYMMTVAASAERSRPYLR